MSQAVCRAHLLRSHTCRPGGVLPEAHVLGKNHFISLPVTHGQAAEAKEACTTVRSKTVTLPTARAYG